MSPTPSNLDITPRIAEGRLVVEGYGDGRFRIGGRVHQGSVIVTPAMIRPWPVASPDDITLDRLDTDDIGPGLLLVGCGPAFVPPPRGLREALRARKIALEWMDTGAACRTFTALVAEGREVTAALVAVG